MKQFRSLAFAAYIAASLAVVTPILAQAGRGDWPMTGNDPGQSGWQRAEGKLSPDAVREGFKFLWKIQLGKPSEVGGGFTEPLLASRLINSHGFKDFVYWASSDTLYAVDSELGQILWTKRFPSRPVSPHGCSPLGVSIAMEPPVAINFNARRASSAPPPAPAEPAAASARRLGVPAGGGYFALKGIYALMHDGVLHEQVLTTGADFGLPVTFLPSHVVGRSSSLIMQSKTAYIESGLTCENGATSLWSINVAAPDYPVSRSEVGRLNSLAISGPAVAPGGSVFVVTGTAHDRIDVFHPNSIIAFDRDLRLSDWYTPVRSTVRMEAVTAITFGYKGKQYVVAPGGHGSIVLLDAKSLGGTDHNTPLAQTASFSGSGARHAWDGFATYVDRSGIAWVYASIAAPITTHPKDATINGATPHGGIVAFRIDDVHQKPVLTLVWISRDLVNPAPPVLGGGVLVVLGGGNQSAHAVLYALDASTGKELFTSGATIPTYTHWSGLSLGDGHVFFTDHNGVLYSFGIGLEH